MFTTRLSESFIINPGAGAGARQSGQTTAEAGQAEPTLSRPGRPLSTRVTLEQDTVSLSAKGRIAQAKDAEETGDKEAADAKEIEKRNGEALHRLGSGEASAKEVSGEEAEGTSEIDKLIAKIEEQIREVEQKMAELTGKDDEASQEQLKLLSDQLVMLNSQLLALYKQKEKMMKNEAEG